MPVGLHFKNLPHDWMIYTLLPDGGGKHFQTCLLNQTFDTFQPKICAYFSVEKPTSIRPSTSNTGRLIIEGN